MVASVSNHSSVMTLAIVVIIAVASSSTAFSPPSLTLTRRSSNSGNRQNDSAVVRHDVLDQLGCRNTRCRHRQPSSLFMNKKKRSQSNSGAKGFGGGGGSSASVISTTSSSSNESSSSSSAATTIPTLIQPKQPPSNFKYAGSIRPGLQSPKRSVPSFSSGKKIIFPDYAVDGKPKARPTLFPWVIEVKKPEEIVKMRRAGRAAREVLDLAGRLVEVGITT